MGTEELLENLSFGGEVFSFNILSLLKIPIILILLGNILFCVLLFLRVRILADTFKAPQNNSIKRMIIAHLFLVVVGTILSFLFVILA